MLRILLLLALLPSLGLAQLKLNGKIVDATTKQPIPFVNIENFRTKAGTQANQNGVFTINLPDGTSLDTLKISCLGYSERLVTNLPLTGEVSYELIPSVFQLKEVRVGGKSKEVEIGVLTKSGHKWESMNQKMQNPGMQSAVFMKNPGYESAYIEKLHFFMGDDMFDAPFRVHVYENINGVPGKDLLAKPLTYTAVKKKSWNAFDVSAYGISIPKDGFWVAIEWIANDQYKKRVEYEANMPDKTKKKFTYTYYGPEIVALFDTDFGLTYYKYLANKNWYKKKGSSSIGFSKRMRPSHIDLLVKSTLKVYD